MARRHIFLLSIFLFSSCTSSYKIEKCLKNATPISDEVVLQASDPAFVNNNTKSAEVIEENLGYRGKNKVSATYSPETMYYSTTWDTLFVAYKNDKAYSSATGLSVEDLMELEDYMLENFLSGIIADSGKNQLRPEYGEYLKILRLYPDSVDVLCSKPGAVASGCSSANPESGFIDIYNVKKEILYTASSTSIEPRITVLAHEYGHLFNFYNLYLKGNLSASYYLKTRLSGNYQDIYPKGLPGTQDTITKEDYYIAPTEIGADDYVELFYKQFNPATYFRSSLTNHSAVKHIYNNPQMKENMLALYQNVVTKTISRFEKPRVIESNCNGCQLTYKTNAFKTENQLTSKFKQQLVAISGREYQGVWYYEVIISPLMLSNQDANLLEQISTRTGYVQASYYKEVKNKEIYTLNDDIGQLNLICSYTKKCTNSKKLKYHLRNDFPFSYFIDRDSSVPTLVMYEYQYVGNQVFSISTEYIHQI